MVEWMNQGGFWGGCVLCVGAVVLRAELRERFPAPAFALSLLAGGFGIILGAR